MLDLTTLWVLTQKHKHALLVAVALTAMFGCGIELGRVTSPYYVSNPIVFSESAAACAEAGNPEALNLLKDAGVAARDADKKTSAPIMNTNTLAVDAMGQGLYVASVNSSLYHHKDCPSAARIKPENQVWFNSKEEAEAAGYTPSQCAQSK